MEPQIVNTPEPLEPEFAQKNLALESQMRRGVNWFFWIAGLSIINSIITLAGVSRVFLVGLGVTQLIDAFMSSLANALGGSTADFFKFVGLGVDIIVAGIFVVFGILGHKRYRRAVIIGMVLYALDGIILLLAEAFLGVVIHAVALFGLWRGLQATSQLIRLEKSRQSGDLVAHQRTLQSQQQPIPLDKAKRKTSPLRIGLVAVVILFCCALVVIGTLLGGLYFASSTGKVNNWVRSVRWSPDGTRLAVGSADKTVRLWDTRSWKLVWTVTDHQDWVRSVAWSPDNAILATGDGSGTIILRDPETGKQIQTLQAGVDALGYVAWSPDGSRLASAGEKNSVVIWDGKSGQKILTMSGHSSVITGVVWSPDGSRVATSSADSKVVVWDARSGKSVYVLVGHSGWVNDLAWSPDGKRLVSGADDGTLILWDTEAGESLAKLKGQADRIFGVAWSPDGTRLASASLDGHVSVWDPETKQSVHSLDAQSEGVLTVSWSPDGAWLAVGTEENTVVIWDAKTWERIRLLQAVSGGK